ncbi:TetR/AcrR family transcriptional regulator C-terminal domain-containing protein [Kitasatospora sp. NPDC004669]|uniref:TetR/AcrR family transcriptional regulator C-terminal domain-containing protein n=1 Tax=Kitasatospora sp. NPDC004669 TaxID=3154555 RepID=UPI0033BC5ACF
MGGFPRALDATFVAEKVVGERVGVGGVGGGAYPALSRVARHLKSGGFDERFEFGLARILRLP